MQKKLEFVEPTVKVEHPDPDYGTLSIVSVYGRTAHALLPHSGTMPLFLPNVHHLIKTQGVELTEAQAAVLQMETSN